MTAIEFLTSNRGLVINYYEKLQNEEYNNGISLKEFGVQVFNTFRFNFKKTNMISSLKNLKDNCSSVVFENSKIITTYDKKTDILYIHSPKKN